MLMSLALSICVLFISVIQLVKGFLKTTDQATTYHRPPTNRPTDQMHQPPSNRPLTSKKFEDQKKFEFIFDITYDFE